jgi:hypothetical protein
MDDADPEGATDSLDPPVAEVHLTKSGSAARNAGLLDASSIGAASSVQVIEGFLDQPIKPTSGIIGGKLAIPRRRIKLRVPGAKRHHFFGRQLLNRCFDFFHITHVWQSTSRMNYRHWQWSSN